MRTPLPRARVQALAAAVALAAFAHASSSSADADARPPHAAVAAATFPAELGFAREVLAEQVRLLLREGAVEVAQGPAARGGVASATSGELISSCARVAAAAANGATHVVLADLRTTERGIDIALRVYESQTCKLASAENSLAPGTRSPADCAIVQ